MSDSAPDAPLPIPSEGPRADANAAWNGPEATPAEPSEPQDARSEAPGAGQLDSPPGPEANGPPPSPGLADLGAGADLVQLVLAELQQKRQVLEQELAEALARLLLPRERVRDLLLGHEAHILQDVAEAKLAGALAAHDVLERILGRHRVRLLTLGRRRGDRLPVPAGRARLLQEEVVHSVVGGGGQ